MTRTLARGFIKAVKDGGRASVSPKFKTRWERPYGGHNGQLIESGIDVIYPPLRILSYCLIRCIDQRITVYSTDLTKRAMASCGSISETGWQICLPTRILLDWLKAYEFGKDDVLELEFKQRICTLQISTGKSLWAEFKGIDWMEFPVVDKWEEEMAK